MSNNVFIPSDIEIPHAHWYLANNKSYIWLFLTFKVTRVKGNNLISTQWRSAALMHKMCLEPLVNMWL